MRQCYTQIVVSRRFYHYNRSRGRCFCFSALDQRAKNRSCKIMVDACEIMAPKMPVFALKCLKLPGRTRFCPKVLTFSGWKVLVWPGNAWECVMPKQPKNQESYICSEGTERMQNPTSQRIKFLRCKARNGSDRMSTNHLFPKFALKF